MFARTAYLVLAHNNPAHLHRLVDSLESPRSEFFVHIDAKSPMLPFASLARDTLRFARQRLDIHWGDYSMVEATLNLMREAMECSDADYFVLLSGSDYPIRSTEFIERFLFDHPAHQFINLTAIPDSERDKPISLITEYKCRPATPRWQRLKRRALCKLGIWSKHRDYVEALGGMQPYAGSQWWTLDRQAVRYVLDFVDQNPAVCAFFENTHAPDESFFHTILGNAPLVQQRCTTLTYTDWSAGGPSPALIADAHLAGFRLPPEQRRHPAFSGEILFARKFCDASERVVRRLEAQRHEYAYHGRAAA